MIEEYYWDLVLKKEDLEGIWKAEGSPEIAKQLNRITQLLEGVSAKGKTGDAWFDDWDGEEDEDKEEPQPTEPVDVDDLDGDDWEDVISDDA